MDATFKNFDQVKHEIQNGDVLLFRRKSLIAIGGRGVYSHAGRVVYWGTTPMCIEIRGIFGGRVTKLEDQVKWRPGCIDVYEVNPDGKWPHYDRGGAIEYMREFVGCNYGWVSLLCAAFLHLPFIRLFVKASTEDKAVSKRPPFCSQAVAMADRIGGGVDPVPNLADRLTEPCDLARSSFYRFRNFTLVP